MSEERKINYYLALGTIPAVIFALTLRDVIESAFGEPYMVAIFLMITGAILLLTSIPQQRIKEIKWLGALIIGLGQALAILPGISRSGTSISAGLFFGIKPIAAAEFSFLLSIPAIIGAIIFKLDEIAAVQHALLGQYFVGTIFSFASGILAVSVLLKLIKKGKFMYFGIYCVIVGLIGLVYFG